MIEKNNELVLSVSRKGIYVLISYPAYRRDS